MKIVLNSLGAINDVLARIVGIVSALLVACIVLIVFGGSITRYVTGTGFNTFLELPRMLMPWLVFPLAGVLMHGMRHIDVQLLPGLLPLPGQRLLRILVFAVSALAGIAFCYAGVLATQLFWTTGTMTEMEWAFPIWWVYLSFPVGFGILTLFSLEGLLRAILDMPDGPKGATESE